MSLTYLQVHPIKLILKFKLMIWYHSHQKTYILYNYVYFKYTSMSQNQNPQTRKAYSSWAHSSQPSLTLTWAWPVRQEPNYHMIQRWPASASISDACKLLKGNYDPKTCLDNKEI